jgi:uncharacterized protein (TIGR02300 family)
MANLALGTKRRCAACGSPFYDLAREPIACPKCKAAFVVEPPAPRRPPRALRSRKPVPVPVVETVAEDPVDEGSVPLLDEEAASEEEKEPAETDEAEGR